MNVLFSTNEFYKLHQIVQKLCYYLELFNYSLIHYDSNFHASQSFNYKKFVKVKPNHGLIQLYK